MRSIKILAASVLALVLTACPKEDTSAMTSAEARDALDEASVSSQASALTSSSVEISTNFTIGKAVKDAAEELRTFIGTQLPCAEITLVDSKLTVAYGKKPGNCKYKGQTFTGSHSITVSRNDDDQVIVDHDWTDLSNGLVKVNGTAHVTWDFDDQYRRVEHDLTWTRISDGRTGHGKGDRTQTPLAGGLQEGIQIDGACSWEGARGKWDLTIEGVQARWADPVPQAGSYRLASPKNRSLTLSFRRVDETTIEVKVTNGDKSFTFNVKGPAAEVEDKG